MSSREHDGLAAFGLPSALPDPGDSHWTRVRVDPDKVVPLMDAAASRAYLAERQ